MPIGISPASFAIKAVTELSTPPDIATITLLPFSIPNLFKSIIFTCFFNFIYIIYVIIYYFLIIINYKLLKVKSLV